MSKVTNGLGLIHTRVVVKAKVVEFTGTDLVCESELGRFILDPNIQPLEKRKLKIGDTFTAMVHPCAVIFCVQEWL